MEQKGRLTLPTDADVVEETLRLKNLLGADALRDCDGTEMPAELLQDPAKKYATYYTTRKDNAWAEAKLAHHAGVVACHSDRSPAVSAQAQSGRGRQGIKKKQCFPSGRHCFFCRDKFRIRPAQSLYFSVPSRICW